MFEKRDKDKIPQEVKERVLSRIKPIIAKELNVSEDKITPETNIAEDLGADSLDATELVIALEEEYGIEIPDDDTDKIRTVEDIVVYLSTKV